MLVGDTVLSAVEIKKVKQLKDLLENMLCVDPEKRYTPRMALDHAFFEKLE